MTTAISYLDDCINPVIGCTKCSEGCLHCWAWEWAKHWKRDFSVVKVDTKKMLSMAKMKFNTSNLKRGAGSKPLVGVCFLSDLFHPAVPADFIISAFECMAYRKDIDWMILTKRPERMVSVLFGEEGQWYLGGGDYYDHIWLGVTAENQARADERIPILLDHWAGPKFVSVEPMLEYVDLSQWLVDCEDACDGVYDCHETPNKTCSQFRYGHLNWVIVGAESGDNRRPFDREGAEAIYTDQCNQYGIPFFGKQDSGKFPGAPLLIDGEIIHQWPVSR